MDRLRPSLYEDFSQLAGTKEPAKRVECHDGSNRSYRYSLTDVTAALATRVRCRQ